MSIIPSMDKRSYDDILNCILKLSENYTPEWRADFSNPDIGTALAMIYANMFNGTIQRFNKASEKNMIKFFNCIGAYIQPAVPAYGYVCFRLATENLKDGIQIKKGISLIAEKNDENIKFKTNDDVLVTNSYIEDIFLTNGTYDVIRHTYKRNNTNETDLFNLCEENLQCHELYIYDDCILNIKSDTEIELRFVSETQYNDNFEESINNLIKEKKLYVEYFADDNFIAFDSQYASNNSIFFSKLLSMPSPSVYDEKTYVIRIRICETIFFKNKKYKSLQLLSRTDNILPEAIIVECEEQQISDFYAFTEKPSAYNELYFASDEIFSKKGASIKISFFIDFKEILLENPEDEIEWKLIMKRSKLDSKPEYDITVNSVIWEYFNGYGWCKLFKNDENSDIFDYKNGRHTKKLLFSCPDDIERTVIGSIKGYFIRARVLKMNNEYKTRGKYISPFIENVVLSYNYQDGKNPSEINIKNNTCDEDISLNSIVEPFKYPENKSSVLYLGFKNAPSFGPIKYLFSIKNEQSKEMPPLEWQYLSFEGWRNINIIDETENFRKTGIVTLMSRNDYISCKMFGIERFWIRITDIMDEYSMKGLGYVNRPVISDIFINAVNVINVSETITEKFSIVPFERNKTCMLKNKMLHDISVWVNEITEHTENELKRLEISDEAMLIYDIYGTIIYAWVRWQEVRNFSLSLPISRHFVVDRNDGTVIFGDGINGKIPMHGLSETIKIEYNCGGGENGNIEVGKVSKSAQSLGIVSTVTNPLDMCGGTDIEKITDALNRSTAMFRSCGRGVTEKDYEAIAKKAERSILKAKCISGVDDSGKILLGSLTMVILIKDYLTQGNSFYHVKERLHNYISTTVNSIVISEKKFYIRQPEFVEYCIETEIIVNNLNNIFDIRNNVDERIKKFLNPVNGNYDETGWNIGCLPNEKQISSIISSVKGVCYIKKIVVKVFIIHNSKRCEISISELSKNKFTIPVSGEHEIVITSDLL